MFGNGEVVRLGLIGAARIAEPAVIQPARDVARVEVVGVAARDRERAIAFAGRHDVARAFESYEAMLASDDIDAVYIALPPSGHATWTMAALDAGKHVLCEKPLSCSEMQAREMVRSAEKARRVLCEAFHWRYHPLASRIQQVLRSGEIGRIRHIEAKFCVAIPDESDIRHQLELGGGAMMDLGCYTVQLARFAADSEPEVVSATAVEGRPGIDLAMDVRLLFADGATAALRCSMAPDTAAIITFRAQGERGLLEVTNPVAPQFGHELRVTAAGGSATIERLSSTPTYNYQLEAFVAAVLDGAALPTGGEDAIATMRVLDACYKQAGLPPRLTRSPPKGDTASNPAGRHLASP